MSIMLMVVGGLLIAEQVLGEIPAIKANTWFQLICNASNALMSALKSQSK